MMLHSEHKTRFHGLLATHLGVWVELEHGTQVLEGVLLEGRVSGALGLGGAHDALDLIAATQNNIERHRKAQQLSG